MKKLSNLVLFSGQHCGGCKTLKNNLNIGDYDIDVVDVESDYGLNLAYKYSIRSLPTCLNMITEQKLVGVYPIQDIVNLNNGKVKLI